MKNIQNFQEFLNEYKTYSNLTRPGQDLNSIKDDLRRDAEISAKTDVIPGGLLKADKEILKVEDQSDDKKGIKFEITLKCGAILHAFKESYGKGALTWEWYVNKKKMRNSQEAREAIEDIMFTPYEKWLYHYEMLDPDYQMADDRKTYSRGRDHRDYVDQLYAKLSTADKRKASQLVQKTIN
jgi:hypothetical protein